MDQDQVEIELPVLRGTDTISQAFGALRDNRKSGVIVSGRGVIMITGRDLSQALLPMKNENALLSEVVETLGKTSPLSKPQPSAGLLSRFTKGPGTPPFSVEDQYRVLKLDGRSALVLVSVDRAKALASPATFYVCEADSSHIWLAEDLVRPGICNLDGEPVHLKT
jgi:CBS domain-containing protein